MSSYKHYKMFIPRNGIYFFEQLVAGYTHYCFFFSLCSTVVSQSTTLQISPGTVVENSPGSKPGTKVICERVQIHGLSRLKNLRKYAHSLKVNVSYLNPSGRPPNAEVCFHR